MILEGLITTRSPDGQPHLAAMGPEVDPVELKAGRIETLVLKPFATSQTARNLAATPAGVFQLTDDVLLLARTVAGGGPRPEMLPTAGIAGWRLADAPLALEFRIVSADRSGERQRLVARVERIHQGRPFVGHVRARHAVVEAAILVTRLHMIPAAEIAARFAELRTLVEKTGGPEEHEAFSILAERVAAGLAASTPTAPPSGVEVRTPARFHLGMFSFGDPLARSFGGTGLMLDEPGIVVRVRLAAAFAGRGPHGERVVEFARHCATAWKLRSDQAFEVEVVAAPRSHVGLGSGTQLALAVAAAIEGLAVRLAEGERSFAPPEALMLARAAGRGRRSSVGAYGFANGGLLVEAGRLGADKLAAPLEASPLTARAELPPAWRGVLIVERGMEGLHGDAERQAFLALPPVDRGVTAELARIALLELVPAALEGRFEAFAEAFGAYGRLAGVPFASASSALPFHGSIEAIIDRLAALGVRGAAQSSWGPAVLACVASEAEAEGVAAVLAADGLRSTHDLSVVGFNASGARLRPITPPAR